MSSSLSEVSFVPRTARELVVVDEVADGDDRLLPHESEPKKIQKLAKDYEVRQGPESDQPRKRAHELVDELGTQLGCTNEGRFFELLGFAEPQYPFAYRWPSAFPSEKLDHDVVNRLAAFRSEHVDNGIQVGSVRRMRLCCESFAQSV